MEALDMSLFISGTPEQQQEFCDVLLNTLKTRGVAKIKNHGIPDKTIHNMFKLARKFFDLPHDEKMKAVHPPKANPNRGYSYVGQENVALISKLGKNPGLTRDIKESFDMGGPSDTLEANRWTDEAALPGFRAEMENFYEEGFKAENRLLSALAMALHVDEAHLRSLHNKADNEFRLLHYPELPREILADGNATRIAEHTDFGTITLLFQDSAGGLEAEDQENLGTFHGVEAGAPTELIMNIGDSMQRLTNDRFRAVTHRVVFPEIGDSPTVPERYSFAYFAKPNRDASLFPLKEFITEAHPTPYEDITAWEWNMQRIAKMYAQPV